MSGTRWLLMVVLALWSITASAQEAAPATTADEEPGNHYSVVRYRSDYEVRDDASSGAYCTRPLRHPEHEVHCSRVRDSATGDPLAIVVWGGE